MPCSMRLRMAFKTKGGVRKSISATHMGKRSSVPHSFFTLSILMASVPSRGTISSKLYFILFIYYLTIYYLRFIYYLVIVLLVVR